MTAPPLRRFLREIIDIPSVFAAPLRRPALTAGLGRGEPVLVLPGFLSNDRSCSLLRRSLDASGFRSLDWGQGTNMGVTPDLFGRLIDRLDEAYAQASGEKVVLLGWSLGGLYARQMASHSPEKVRMVMTLGIPFSGSLRANNAWRIYELINGHAVDDPPSPVNFEAKPPVPTFALWSRRDGIVSQASAQGEHWQSDESIELPVTHMGFGASRSGVGEVVRLLGERLRN